MAFSTNNRFQDATSISLDLEMESSSRLLMPQVAIWLLKTKTFVLGNIQGVPKKVYFFNPNIFVVRSAIKMVSIAF